MDKYISQAAAAKRLHLSRQAIYSAIERGHLRTVTIAGRRIITESDLLHFANERVPKGWAGYHSKRAKQNGESANK